MPLKDKIKVLVKSPFFWLVVAIGFIGISILVVSMISGKDKCPPGTSRGQCGDKCVPTCPSGKYDCSTNKCACIDNQIMCNGECCPTDQCIGGLCCSENRQCPIGPGGAKQCCPNGQICDLKSNKCVSICAVNGNECKSGESCLTVGPIKDKLQDKFYQDFSTYSSAKCANDICSVCVPESKCQFNEDQPSPAALKESSGNIGNYYPCTNIINGTDENGVVGYCSSDKPTGYALACNEITTKAGCTDTGGTCTWRNIFDKAVTSDLINKDIANIGSSDPKITYEGNWCGNQGLFLHVNKMKQSEGSTGCDVTTCWNELNKHPNIIDIHWDKEGGVCTSVASCATGTPVGFSAPPCKEDAQPSICKGSDYTCATTGRITTTVPDACAPYKSCNAVIVSENHDIGWCINETSPGVYEQSCALSEDACTGKGPGAIFVQSPLMCPYTKDGSAGCGPNNYLSKSDDGKFKCDLMDPQPQYPIPTYCDSGGFFANANSLKMLVSNRTRWPITMTLYNCAKGKACDGTPTPIAPYSREEYHAGASSDFFSDNPICAWNASIDQDDFDPKDHYQISVDTKGGEQGVTIYNMMPLGSNLLKAVKVTAKLWTYDTDMYNVASVIFYPAWEIPDSDDAKITN